MIEDNLDENQKDTIRNCRNEFRNCFRSIIENHEQNLIPAEFTKKELSLMFCVTMFASYPETESQDYFGKLLYAVHSVLSCHYNEDPSSLWEKIPRQFDDWDDVCDQ